MALSQILSVSLAVLVLLVVGMDNEDGTWGYYDPHPYSSFSYNYYGSSHLQQFPHYECAPIRVSQTSEAKGGEPSSHHSFSEASDEDCVEMEVSFDYD